MTSSPNKRLNLCLNRNPSRNGPCSPSKRLKLNVDSEDEIRAKRRRNFKIACEQVSRTNYFDHRKRFLLVYLPSCIKTSCKHHDENNVKVKRAPYYVNESFMIETRNKAWYEAIEVCRSCLTPTQYLSSDILKGVVDIILNAHEDEYSEYSVQHIIDNCQQILMQTFSTHPPCVDKEVRNNYISFLTSPLEHPRFVNNKKNKSKILPESDMSIVKYCMTKLEYELGAGSIDGPLIDKAENMPEEWQETIRGFYWQKKNEYFKALNRQERIERLFAVLEVVVELLQFDLAIVQSRYTSNQGRIKRLEKLSECVLQCGNKTGIMTENIRQIVNMFVDIIHLQYPESIIKTCVIWLNTIVQTLYMREIDSNIDYPNPCTYSKTFANEFYKILADKPYDSIVRILQNIEPTFMRYLVGLIHINKILSTDDASIVRILINFMNKSQWQIYSPEKTIITLTKNCFSQSKEVNTNIINTLERNIRTSVEDEADEDNKTRYYAKRTPETKRSDTELSLNHIVRILYVTLEAYLDAYNIQSVYEKWIILNNRSIDAENDSPKNDHYSTTDSLVKEYIGILNTMTEYMELFNDLKTRNKLPEIMYIFENISIFKLYNLSSTWNRYR